MATRNSIHEVLFSIYAKSKFDTSWVRRNFADTLSTVNLTCFNDKISFQFLPPLPKNEPFIYTLPSFFVELLSNWVMNRKQYLETLQDSEKKVGEGMDTGMQKFLMCKNLGSQQIKLSFLLSVALMSPALCVCVCVCVCALWPICHICDTFLNCFIIS